MSQQHESGHTFRGIVYLPCSSLDARSAGYRWYRVTTHYATGLDYSEQHSPKFRTLRDCREDAEYVDQQRSLVAND